MKLVLSQYLLKFYVVFIPFSEDLFKSKFGKFVIVALNFRNPYSSLSFGFLSNGVPPEFYHQFSSRANVQRVGGRWASLLIVPV